MGKITKYLNYNYNGFCCYALYIVGIFADVFGWQCSELQVLNRFVYTFTKFQYQLYSRFLSHRSFSLLFWFWSLIINVSLVSVSWICTHSSSIVCSHALSPCMSGPRIGCHRATMPMQPSHWLWPSNFHRNWWKVRSLVGDCIFCILESCT